MVEFSELRLLAIEAAKNAYTPYSHFPVGAAAEVDDGRIITGCNVENVSYGLTLCAECGLVGDLHRTGGGRIVRMSVVAADHKPVVPCGRCRQILWEAGGGELELDWDPEPIRLAELLPLAFEPEQLDRSPDRRAQVDTTEGNFYE
jgi:cytidine deaminase